MRIRTIILSTLLACSSFVQAQTVTLQPFYKKSTNCNPLNAFHLCADPTAVEYNGRLYVYGTNDQLEFTTGDKNNNTYGKINQLVCMSSDDLINWTFHGTIDVKAVCKWCWTSWAPSIVKREEAGGKTNFYMYFTNGASGIGVMKASSPLGPWTDPIGKALIDGSTPGRGVQSNIIDPGVCVDDEGNGWLTFGGGDPNREGSHLIPGNARIVKLGKNMASLASAIVPIPAPLHFEANELNYIDGKFIFTYSGGWSPNGSEWNGYSGKNGYPCPSACSIMAMSTDDPLSGEWTYNGEVLKNPGQFGYPYGNNHSHIQDFQGQWYMIYHTQELIKSWGYGSGYRSIAMNKISWNATKKQFNAATMSGTGITQMKDKYINPFEKVEAETMSNASGISAANTTGNGKTVIKDIDAGDWIQLRGVKFDETAKSVTLRVKGTGALEFRTSTTTGGISNAALAKVEFSRNTLGTVTVDLSRAINPKSYPYFYVVFTRVDKAVELDYYQFNALSVDEQTPVEVIEADEDVRTEGYYSMDGKRLPARPVRGMYIEKVFLPDGSVKGMKRIAE